MLGKIGTYFNNIKGVKSLYANIDGALTDDWYNTPDSVIISSVKSIIPAICLSFPSFSGVTIDLEPFRPKYRAKVLLFVKELSTQLRSNPQCTQANATAGTVERANGLSISMFVGGVGDTPQDLKDALGPNGYVVISGYDLSEGDPKNPVATSPNDYRSIFTTLITSTRTQCASVGLKYAIAIPAAASTQEFERANTSSTTVSGFSQDQYVQVAVESIKQNVFNDGLFVGTLLWTFSPEINVQGTRFMPNYPTIAVLDYLKNNL